MKVTRIALLAGAALAAAMVFTKARAEDKKDKAEPVEDVGAETASHEEIAPLDVKFKRLTSLRLGADGNLLACDGDTKAIRVISPEGKLVATYEPGFGPEAIDVAADGTIYCGGEGQLARLDATGHVIKTVKVPKDVGSPVSGRRTSSGRAPRISGIAAGDKDLFVAFGSGWSLGSKSKLFRFDRDLENPKMLVEGLRGCCQRCDIVAAESSAYVAENAAHRIVRFDRDGRVLNKWGERGRTNLAGFGSCCNPMNLCFGTGGVLYTAESGIGRVKRYTPDGKYLGLVGYIGVERFNRAGRTAASCSNIAIDVTPDGKRVYVMDFKNNIIRVLQQKG